MRHRPAPRRFRRSATVALLVGVTGAALAGCFPAAVEISPPTPTGPAAEACRRLRLELPENVDGGGPRDVEPDSPYSAAWGDPPVVLRCGVEPPPALDPASDAYQPTIDAVQVNGVDWLPEQEADGVRFTTVDRRANVQVWVQGPPETATEPLVDLAEAVRTAVPSRV